MKTLFINLILIFFLFSCQSQEENTTKKVEQKQVEKTETQKVRAKLKPNLDCKQTMQWLRENAIAINPDTFPSNLHQIAWDSSYKTIDTLLIDCFQEDSLIVKNYSSLSKDNEFYQDTRTIYNIKLCDVYTNEKNQVEGFTVVHGTGDGGRGLSYISIIPNKFKIINVVELANLFGDVGMIVKHHSTWLNDSTLIKNMQHSFLDSTLYQASIQINLLKNGKILLSNPKIRIDNIPIDEKF